MDKKILTFKDVIGCDYAKERLKRRLELYYLYKEKMDEFGIKQDLGIIMYGYPGVGKSRLAKSCIGEFNLDTSDNIDYREIDGSVFMADRVGQPTRVIHKYFRELMEQPNDTILIIDECDTLFKSISKTTSQLTQERTNALLREIDSEKIGSKIFIIGTTNKPYEIDKGFYRRLQHMYVEMPNEKERILHLKKTFENIIDINDSRIEILAKHTEKYSGDDFTKLRTELFYKYKMNGNIPLDCNDVNIVQLLTDEINNCKTKMSSIHKTINDFKRRYESDNSDSICGDEINRLSKKGE